MNSKTEHNNEENLNFNDYIYNNFISNDKINEKNYEIPENLKEAKKKLIFNTNTYVNESNFNSDETKIRNPDYCSNKDNISHFDNKSNSEESSNNFFNLNNILKNILSENSKINNLDKQKIIEQLQTKINNLFFSSKNFIIIYLRFLRC